MKLVNLGNDVSTVQWENENEFRAYPFSAETCPEGFPFGIVTDLSIACPEGSSEFRLASLHVGPGMVSVSISNGLSFLVCTVLREVFVPYQPYPMTNVAGTVCAGACSFGDIVFEDAKTLKFSHGPVVLPSLVVSIPSGRVKCFVDENTGEKATGNVGMSIPDDLVASKVIDERGQVLEFTMSQRLTNATVSPCASSDDTYYADEVPPIRSINGVEPDSQGRIAVVFQ